MATSVKKIAANRSNGQKSHGPRDTTSTRFNASKHGLLAKGITELDDAESYHVLLNDLRKEKAPLGIVEHLLVESVALEMIRLRRARRLEAEYITGELNPPTTENNLFGLLNEFEPTILDPGLPAAIGFEIGQRLVNVFQRYESTFVTRMLRLLHELERIQRMRSGERLPAPAVMDVSVHASTSSLPEDLESAETGTVTHGFAATEHSTSHSVDVEVQADAGTVDSASAQFERPTELSGYKE